MYLRLSWGAHPCVIYYPRGIGHAWSWMFVVRPWPWAYRRRWGWQRRHCALYWMWTLGMGWLGFSLNIQKIGRH